MSLKIAVASGKGGTGKTTVAANLAWTIARRGESVAYLDCDTEEPNGHIFLKPRIDSTEPVRAMVPQMDLEKCTLCGKCAEICRFSAIAVVGKKVLTFPELCHHCGGCALVCPTDAVTDAQEEIGTLRCGWAGPVRFVDGRLEIGVSTAPPVVRAVKGAAGDEAVTVMDAPPGTTCPVVETVEGADFGVLVTEPTPFGLNDLLLTVEMFRKLGVPHAVVINRSDVGNSGVRDYCREEEVEVIAEIPFDRKIAESYSRGELVAEGIPWVADEFEKLYSRLLERVPSPAAGGGAG